MHSAGLGACPRHSCSNNLYMCTAQASAHTQKDTVYKYTRVCRNIYHGAFSYVLQSHGENGRRRPGAYPTGGPKVARSSNNGLGHILNLLLASRNSTLLWPAQTQQERSDPKRWLLGQCQHPTNTTRRPRKHKLYFGSNPCCKEGRSNAKTVR